jgi:hypothetical protein
VDRQIRPLPSAVYRKKAEAYWPENRKDSYKYM